MKSLQDKRDDLSHAILAALSQHYNAGIELGRAEGASRESP